ncbi:MAG: hypothetical protein KKF27_20395 [Gammaproteobacteria bacterium]|nr:hypothetical protein [Gammaproteobacteria bacterium]MBU2685608.1 hypothetical protein [Gammaproteobacteria bacterium]
MNQQKSRRTAPSNEPVSRKKITSDPEYDSLRADKKRLHYIISEKEEEEITNRIKEKMKKTFGPTGGEYRVLRLVKGTGEEI